MNQNSTPQKTSPLAMNADAFQQACLRTVSGKVTPGQAPWLNLPPGTPIPSEIAQLNWATGLAGEAGEYVDLIKKHLFHDHPADRDRVLKELGDVAWYLAVAAHEHGFTLTEVFETNIEKLKARYPDGFDPKLSQAVVRG